MFNYTIKDVKLENIPWLEIIVRKLLKMLLIAEHYHKVIHIKKVKQDWSASKQLKRNLV